MQAHAQSHARSHVLTHVLTALASVGQSPMWHLVLVSALQNLVHQKIALASSVLSRKTLGKHLAGACLHQMPGPEAQLANDQCLVVCCQSWSHCKDYSPRVAVRLEELPWQRSWWRQSKRGLRVSR